MTDVAVDEREVAHAFGQVEGNYIYSVYDPGHYRALPNPNDPGDSSGDNTAEGTGIGAGAETDTGTDECLAQFDLPDHENEDDLPEGILASKVTFCPTCVQNALGWIKRLGGRCYMDWYTVPRGVEVWGQPKEVEMARYLKQQLEKTLQGRPTVADVLNQEQMIRRDQ